MTTVKKDGSIRKKMKPIYCDIPGCPDYNTRNMGNAHALTVHKHYKHGIINDIVANARIVRKEHNRMSKNDKEVKAVEEQVVTTQQQLEPLLNTTTSTTTPNTPTTTTITPNTPPTIDISGLENKLDSLVKMIPPNLCEEFPHLCKLGERIDIIENRLGDIKENIPKKITVNIPKQSLPEVPTPSVDVQSLSKNILDGILPNIKLDIEPLSNVISTELKSLSEILKSNYTKPEEKIKAEELIKEVINIEESVHKTPGDYFNCPECRQSLLNALQDRINSKEERDPDTIKFIENIRDAIIPLDEGKHEHNREESVGDVEQSDKDITTTSNGRSTDERGGEEEESNTIHNAGKEEKDESADKEKHDGNESTSESTYDESGKCTGGWCLLRRKRA